MKRIEFILGLMLFSASLMATDKITHAKDTAVIYENNTILLSGKGDSFQTSIISNTGDTIPVAKETKTITEEIKESSIKLGGSSCNFIFSWEKEKNFDPHWAGFGFGFVGLDNLNGVDLEQSTSYSFSLNLMEYYVPLSRNHWLLVSGLGLDWSRYHFEGNYGLTKVNGTTQFQPAPEGVEYSSSKLLTYYATVPLLLEYQTQTAANKITKKQDFFVSGGIVGYLKAYSKSQVEYPIIGEKEQRNLGRDLNIIPVNMRLMFQIGIESVSLYGYYSPFSLFQNGKGPDIHPTGIGLMFNF